MRTPRLATGTAALGGRHSSLARVAAAVLAAALSGTCRDSHAPTTPADAITQTATVTAPGTPAVLVGAGEITRCDNSKDEATALLLDSIPGTVFTTGDNVRASGSLPDFTACYGPSWGRHKARTRPAAGPYDYQTAGAAGYFDYFGSAAGERDKGYYSYELGAWHVVVLNSNLAMTVGSAQEQWLRADLAASTERCTLAYWQHPRFSSYSTAVRAAVKPLWDALYAAHADVVLNGHYRLYERFAPQTPDGGADPEHGIRQFTVGTGGHGVHAFGTAVRPNSEVRLSGTYGVLKLTLSDGSYSWQFVPVAGQTAADSGSGACHKTAASRPAVSASQSTVTASRASLTARSGSVTITVTAKDANGTPISGATVVLAATGTGNTLTPPSDTTGASGVAAGTLGSTVAEAKTVSATINGIAVTQTATVTVTAPVSAILVGAGNIARCDRTNDEATAALLDAIPGTVFALGDDANPSGTAANYANCYEPGWGRHKARTSPAPGNHDYDSSATAASYFNYFGAAAGEPGKGYYSYDLGAWHIIVLNSNHTYVSTAEGSAQLAWLKADLAANSKRCVLAMWHRPRFYSTTSSAFFETPAVRPFWEYLYAAHATLIVNAHMRDYERFAPQDPAGVADPENGIRQFIVGTGGEGLDNPNTLIAPNSEVRISGVYGVLKLTLGDGTYFWQFVPVAGQTATDSGTDACHRAPGWVTVSPAGADLLVGGTVQVTATIHDGSGNVVTDGTVTWSSSDTLVATVDGNGLVTAVGAVGSPATITATSERRRGVSLVHVSLSPTTPTAAFALGCSGLSCTFTDQSTDGDGRVAAWSWDFGDATTSTSQSPSHTYGADGTYIMALTVTDDSGKTASAAKKVLVRAANPPDEVPVASFVIPYGCRFRWCNFTDASRDPDGRVVAWKWEFGDGTTSTSQSPGGHTYRAAGLYRVHLTVTDDGGATGDVTQLVQAPAPAAYFTYDCSGLTCTFTDQSTSGGVTLGFVGWYFGDGTGRRQNAYDSFEKRPPVEHTFFRSGTYTVVLSLSDGYEYLASTSKSVTVKTLHPVAGGTCSCVALACVFMDDRTDDPDGRVVAWSWNFGDGGTSVLRNPSHTYTADGTYTARFTITDDSGGTSSASWSCTVREYPGVWSTWVSLPTPRSGLGVGAIDEILYALGGDTIVDNAGGAVSTLEAFEPDRETWTTKASMPTSRYGLGVAAIDGILYAVGGANSNGNLATLEAYDPRTDAWTTKASMPTPRTALGVAASNGILYAVGGSRGNGELATLEAYDPRTDTWTTKASMPTPRAGLGFAALRGMMLCAVGGASFGPLPTYRQTVEAYHPETNSWTTKGSMPTPRYGLGVAATFHEVLWAFGGYAPGFGLLASSESFIP